MHTDKPQALQVPATLMERLGIAVGEPAVVYLMGVHACFRGGMGPGLPYETAVAQAAPEWCPPRPGPCPPYPGPGPCPPSPGPGPCPPCPPGPGVMMGTTVLNGTLAFAGVDYIDLHAPIAGAGCREVLVPYNAIGMILPGGPMV